MEQTELRNDGVLRSSLPSLGGIVFLGVHALRERLNQYGVVLYCRLQDALPGCPLGDTGFLLLCLL
jgi:hypothetical protein